MSTHNEVRINQSVAVLIDGNNIEKGLQKLANDPNALLDFDKIIPKLIQDRGLKRLIYFREGISISDKLADRLLTNYHGSVVPCHKSADIPLTIMATQIAPKVDTIIILSGDSDYVELVRHLKGEGVRTEIAAVQHTTAKILVDEVEHFTPITLEDCYILKTPGRTTSSRSTSKSRSSSSKRTSSTSSKAKSSEKATKSKSTTTSKEKSKSSSKRAPTRRKKTTDDSAKPATQKATKEPSKKPVAKRTTRKRATPTKPSAAKSRSKATAAKVDDWDDLSF